MGTSSAARGPKKGHYRQFVLRTGTSSFIRRPKKGPLSATWPPIRGQISAIRHPIKGHCLQLPDRKAGSCGNLSSEKESFWGIRRQYSISTPHLHLPVSNVPYHATWPIPNIEPILFAHDRLPNLDCMALVVQS